MISFLVEDDSIFWTFKKLSILYENEGFDILIARFSRDHCNLYLFAVFDCFDCSPVTFSLFYFNMLKNFWIHIYSNNIDFTAVYNEFYFKIFTKIFFNIHQNLLLNSLKFTSIFTKIYFNIHFKLFHSYLSRSCNEFTSLLV